MLSGIIKARSASSTDLGLEVKTGKDSIIIDMLAEVLEYEKSQTFCRGRERVDIHCVDTFYQGDLRL